MQHELQYKDDKRKNDQQRMQAFISFHKQDYGRSAYFVAWYQPLFKVEKACAAYFQQRFPTSRWAITTPQVILAWTGERLIYKEGEFTESSASKFIEDIMAQSRPINRSKKVLQVGESSDYLLYLQKLILGNFSKNLKGPCLTA